MDIGFIHKLNEYKIIENPFDYSGLDSEMVSKYQQFENQFEKLYLDKINRFKLKDCFFYIKDDLSCNAFARSKRGYNIIGITKGYAIQMLNAFSEKNFSNTSILKLIQSNDVNISDGYKSLQKISDFNISNYMLDCSTQFTFGHEFHHIMQFNSSNLVVDDYMSENINLSNFNLKRHAWELNADFFATWDVTTHILNVKNSYYFRDKESVNQNTFICFLFLGIGSVCITKTLSYFGAWNFKQDIQKIEFYTKNHSHPHPLVRILNILDSFYDQMKDSLPMVKIEKQDLLNNVLIMIAIYFETFAPNKKILSYIFKDMDDYLDIANDYKNELYDVAVNDESIRTLLIKRGINFE